MVAISACMPAPPLGSEPEKTSTLWRISFIRCDQPSVTMEMQQTSVEYGQPDKLHAPLQSQASLHAPCGSDLWHRQSRYSSTRHRNRVPSQWLHPMPCQPRHPPTPGLLPVR